MPKIIPGKRRRAYNIRKAILNFMTNANRLSSLHVELSRGRAELALIDLPKADAIPQNFYRVGLLIKDDAGPATRLIRMGFRGGKIPPLRTP